MNRIKSLLTGIFLALLIAPVAAGELDALVKASDGAMSCWSRSYDDQHLAQHPQQTVTDMQFVVGHLGETESHPAMYWFELHAGQRGGSRGATAGSCWSEGGEMRCNVDCDGGGVVATARDNGRVLLDLETFGYIRMNSACGGGSENESYSLEAGIDDKQFLLHPVTSKQCKAMRPDWLE